MSRFYLTTAIDYVNSKPHLGTAYEKVGADVIARYKRLAGFDVRFCMGNDEHSQNVYRKARELGEDPLAYCDRMERVFRDVWGKLHISFDDFIRTTEPRHKAAVQKMAQACLDNGDVYRRRLRRLVLRLVRGVQAGEGSRRRALSDSPDETGLDPGEELLLPALEVSRSSARALRGESAVPAAGHPAQRDPAPARSRPRGHFDQPRRTVVGHSAAVRSRQRRLRLVRRVDQLRGCRGLRHRSGSLRDVVAGEPARDRQGHHAVPHGGLARDADERGRRAAASGLRPWLGPLQGPEDEQVARHGRRSDRGGRSSRSRSASPLSGEGSAVRRRWRLLVGALRGALQRRPRQQPRQPRQPDYDDGGEVSRGQARSRLRSGRGGWRVSRRRR